MKKSCVISKETDGAFDITYAPLGDLWSFKSVPFAVPRREKILETISLVDYQFF
ncbi:MAG: hypothetical protein GY699_17855 [Desulfobacteraceae bacterium]|nr:hypothetical protein [Desulfobacteraceae bacterium]